MTAASRTHENQSAYTKENAVVYDATRLRMERALVHRETALTHAAPFAQDHQIAVRFSFKQNGSNDRPRCVPKICPKAVKGYLRTAALHDWVRCIVVSLVRILFPSRSIGSPPFLLSSVHCMPITARSLPTSVWFWRGFSWMKRGLSPFDLSLRRVSSSLHARITS